MKIMNTKRIVGCASVAAMSISLSGCIIAAVPIIMAVGAAGVAVTGFVVYKSVQTASGGTVRIAFGSTDAKQATPPPPLTATGAIAVAGGSEMERKLTEALKASGRFRVTQSEGAAVPTDPTERTRVYDSICQRMRASVVMAAVDKGQTVNSNMLSFKRGALTHKLDLEGYGCSIHKLVWADTMAIVVESGKTPTPQAEIDSIAGQAWADRIVQASKES